MLFKKSVGIKKTSFENRLNTRLQIKPLFDTDLNLKIMKKDIINYIPNQNLYNYILENYYYINNYYNLLSIYYPLYSISFKQITEDVKVKCINFTYDNDPKNNFNFITFFYSANTKDENMTMDNFLYFSYGSTLESADGEVKLGSYNKAYFYYIFNYNNPSPNLFNFLDKIYELFLKYDFFKINNILITENLVLVNNIFYFKFLSFTIFNSYYSFSANLLYNNTHMKFIEFLKKNSKILNKILKEFTFSEINLINTHYSKMLTEIKPRNKSKSKSKSKNDSNIFEKYNIVYYFSNLHSVTKYIPKDSNNDYLNELNINYKLNLLLFNNITCFIPLTINHANIKNKFIYNNINIINKFKLNKKYINIINLLTNIKQTNKLEQKKDIKTNTTSPNIIYDIQSMINKLNKNIISDESICILMEDVGRPFYDYPFFILNKIKETIERNNIKKNNKQNFIIDPYEIKNYNLNFIHVQLFYYNIRYYLFNIIYTLYTINIKFGLIHRDLHLNNITVNINQTNRCVSNRAIFELKDKNISDIIFLSKLFALNRNLFIIKNKNIKHNAFLIPNNFYNTCIIDFSRALDKKNKYECTHQLFEMFLDIFPEYMNNNNFKDKLYKTILLNTDIFFDIMTGFDIYYFLTNLYSFFTDDKFIKLKFFPQTPIKELNFIAKIIHYIEITILKNTKKLMNSKFKGYITNTNELILYKFYNNFLLKNYNKNDFFIPKFTKTDRPSYFQYLDDDEWISLYNSNQIYIINIFNAENTLKITSIEEYINKYINVSNKDINKKINRYIR